MADDDAVQYDGNYSRIDNTLSIVLYQGLLFDVVAQKLESEERGVVDRRMTSLKREWTPIRFLSLQSCQASICRQILPRNEISHECDTRKVM